MYSGDEVYGDDVTSGDPDVREARERARHEWEEAYRERLAHTPFASDPVSGIRFCMICDEPWPCATRRGERIGRIVATLEEEPNPEGDPHLNGAFG